MGMRKGYKQTQEHKDKKASGRKRGSFFNCEICGNKFWRMPSEIKKGNCRFCSRECYQKWQTARPKSDKWKQKRIANNKNRAKSYPLRRLYKYIRESNEYKDWRKSVFQRDGYTCHKCGNKSTKGKYVYIQAHHKKPFALFPEERFAIDNGITLCKPCHDNEPKGREICNAKY